jgi:hypothetical protein
MMRAAALIVGAGMAVVGLVAAQAQLLDWQQYGFYMPIRLSTLWIAFWGASSDFMCLRDVLGSAAWLLDQPLRTVLPLVGVFLAWTGMSGVGRTSLRL